MTAYRATILRADEGRRLVKLYRDPNAAPEDYDAGVWFDAEEIECPTFDAFVTRLASLDPDECLIRGAVRADKRDVVATHGVRRLAYDDLDDAGNVRSPAIFEPAPRNWVVLDADETDTPFDPTDPAGSVSRWRASLPATIRTAQSAFFLSASAHRSATVRGKLVVALAEPLDNESAEAFAKAHGFDGSVCRTVQPNYFAAPMFVGCEDPIAAHRAPIRWRGKPATLPTIVVEARTDRELGARAATPVQGDVSERVRHLAVAVLPRWLVGGRVETNAWLHLAGWCLGKGWSKAEVRGLLEILDRAEPNAAKREEHLHILGNARAIEGPGGAREWLGDCFAHADRAIAFDAGLAASARRREQRDAFASPDEGRAPEDGDALGRIVDWSTPVMPLRYLCAGLGIGWVGKSCGVHGYAGSSKGLFLSRLLLSAASGLPFLGHDVTRVPVLYLDAETGALAENRIKRLAIAMGINLAELAAEGWWTFRHTSEGLPSLIESGSIEQALARINRGDGAALGCDSYSSMVGGDENDSEYADPLWQLGQICQRVDTIPLLAMHERKDSRDSKGPVNPMQGISGTNRLAAALASSIRLTPDEDNDREIKVTCTRAPEKRFEPLVLTWADTPEGGIAAEHDALRILTAEERRREKHAAQAREVLAAKSSARERLLAFLESHPEPGTLTIKKIRESLSLSLDAWNTAREELLADHLVVEDTTGRQVTYRLAELTDVEGVGKVELPVVGRKARR